MATSRATVSVKPVWINFTHGKAKAALLKKGKKLSRVKYLQAFKSPTYEAKRGEERMVWNEFITPRRE